MKSLRQRSFDKEGLLEKIGSLSREHVQQVFEGIYHLLKPEVCPL